MKEVVKLKITTYRGSIGAEHYYGQFWVEPRYTRRQNDDGSSSLILVFGHSNKPHPLDKHDLDRKIGAKEALYLNKKDDDGFPNPFRLKAGDRVTRFNDRETIIEAAIEAFPRLFDTSDVLLYGDEYRDDVSVLLAPPDIREIIEHAPDKGDWRNQLMELGYLVKSEATGDSECPHQTQS